jgi:cytochrome P450
LTPSPTLAEWRAEAPATSLLYDDGHRGWIATRYDLVRAVLEDPRFSQQPQRMPASATAHPAHGSHDPEGDAVPGDAGVDPRAQEASDAANLLGLDEPQHLKIRRSVTSRFSVRSARAAEPVVSGIVRRQLEHLLAQGSPVDLTEDYALPISALVHCHALGIADHLVDRFIQLFVRPSTTQQKVDFVRDALDAKRDHLGEDTISDLLRSELSRAEIEGVVLVLMTSGRDSVAYMIATTTVALLTHPEQLTALREDPDLISTAVEEFMRFGAMFITLFPRTATEDLELEGVLIRAGETVSVSPVAANRDERHFEHPEVFDVHRDAFGHLGFGHGGHGCVGQQLARVEIRQAISQLIAAVPTLFLVEAEQTAPMPFAHPVATYESGSVIVGWEPGTATLPDLEPAAAEASVTAEA